MKEIIIEVPDRFGQELKPEKVNSEIKGELVRCKDCKYWKNGYRNYDVHPWLPCMEIHTNGKWFCGYGERQEAE